MSHLVIIAFLVLVSALLSCAEVAIIMVSRARIHRLRNEGNKRAKILESLLKNRERIIGVILLSNNGINVLISVIATSVLTKIFGEEMGLIYASIIATLLILILGEITPKTIALRAPESISLLFAFPINILVKLLFPLTNFIQKAVNWTVSLFFFESKKRAHLAEIEDIRDTVDLKYKEGLIYSYDKEMLGGVLDLGSIEVAEVMVHRKNIESIDINLPLAQIIERASILSYYRIPLWSGNEENIVGILNVNQLFRQLSLNCGNVSKLDLKQAISKPWFVPPNNSLRAQLSAFRKKKSRFALVVDEYGSLLGLITVEDILEEIVGEIKENDAGNAFVESKGIYKIPGNALLRDLTKKMRWNFEASVESYDVAGLIINGLGRIPDEKENFIIDGYYFEILKRKGNNIVSVRMKKVGES